MFKVLHQLFVSQFYKLNTGFFLFWFLLFFGVVSGSSLISYHLSLIQAIITIIPLQVIVMAGWLLYALKCLRYMENTLLRYNASFLHVLGGVNGRRLNVLVGYCYALALAPVTVYALVVTVIAVQQSKYGVALSIILFLVTVSVWPVRRLTRMIKAAVPVPTTLFYEKWLRRSKPLPWYWFLVQYAVKERKMNLLVLKSFSLFLFFLAFIWLSDDFVKPAFMLLLVLVALAHAVFMLVLQKFKEEKLLFIRNLPVPVWKRLGLFVLPVCLLFVPELLFMLINGWKMFSLGDMFMSYTVLVSQLVLFTAVLYITSMPAKTYMRVLFVICFANMFALLAFDHLLLVMLWLLAGLVIFAVRYRHYEHVIYTD